MTKRILALLLAGTMALSLLSGCGNNNNNNNDTESSSGSLFTEDESSSDSSIETGSTEPSSTENNSTVINPTEPDQPSSPSDPSNPSNPSNPSDPSTPNEPEIKVITIAEALKLCGEEGNVTTERYYIRGTVTKMIKPQYGNMVITDATGSITVYGTYSADGSTSYAEMTEKAFEGDEVLLSCILQNYNGTKEVKNARLIEFKKAQVTYDPKDYKDMTIAAVRDAAEGAKAKVTGTVAAITYAFGQVPSGVILVDKTQSIYVYDTNLAGQVKVGNTVTILGSKTYWILEDEVNNASKFGYKGCCQLEKVTLISNDNKVSSFDKSWIKTTTIKDIMENDKKNDITSSLYKVNALISKQEGKGFTNYYIYDLDGKTGSYTYTQCNGSDFTWLDKYDGKICTVYLTAINAKSTSSGCIYRFLPVEVKDENFKFNSANVPQHVVDYYGIPQFESSYTGNPELEVLTSVSSDLLGFKNATLSYKSDNTKVIDFKTENGKTIMHCLSTGSANITITGSYNGKTYNSIFKINVEIAASNIKAMTVKEAINAAVGNQITVKGIVGPSLVNKTGFYLIDETGVIAVTMETDVLATLSMGHEVVLKGTRDLFNKATSGSNEFGQTCITNCEVVTNFYGKHDYSTATFIENFTLDQFYKLDYTKDFSTQVYVLKATVSIVETNFYSNIQLTDGSTKVNLYCADAKQYSFLKAYAGQEVTVEIAPCNWNDKSYWAGAVLAVRTADGKIWNNCNFQGR